MSGSLYQYTPYPVAGQPQEAGAAFRSGFVGSQEIERNAQALQEAEQLMKLRQLQSERSAAAEARTAQLFPVQLSAAEQTLKRNAQMTPLELEGLRLRNALTSTSIGERAGAAAATRGIVFPTLPSGQPAPAPRTPGVAVPDPGLMAPEVVNPSPAPAASVPGPQSSAPDWLNQQFGERRFPGVQVASAGVGDWNGLPAGVTPEMINGQPGVVVTAEAPAAPAEAPGRGEYTGTDITRISDSALRNILRASIPGGGGPAFSGLMALSPEQREATFREARLEAARRFAPRSNQYAGVSEESELAPFFDQPRTSTQLPQTRADFGAANVEYPDLTPGQVRQAREDRTATERLTERPSEIYLVEPVRIGMERNQLNRAYARLQSEFRAAVASRDREGAARLAREAEGIVDQLGYLDGMAAISRFRNGDVAPIANQMYTESQNRMQVQPRSDGTFNLYLDGRLSSQGVTKQQLEDGARALFDTRRREQLQAAQTRNIELAMYQAKQRIEQLTRASADIAVKEVEAALKANEPSVDIRTVTDATGQQFVIISDKRTGMPIRSGRVVKLPPAPGTTEDRYTVEVSPVAR
jgi:hypothetical protein